MGEMRNGYKIFIRKPEGKRLLGRPGSRWEDNVRMDLWVTGWATNHCHIVGQRGNSTVIHESHSFVFPCDIFLT